MRLEMTYARLEMTHARLEITHTRLEMTHARLEMTHARLEMTYARLEMTYTRLEMAYARLEDRLCCFGSRLYPLESGLFLPSLYKRAIFRMHISHSWRLFSANCFVFSFEYAVVLNLCYLVSF